MFDMKNKNITFAKLLNSFVNSTLGLNGGSITLFSISFQSTSLKNGWFLTSNASCVEKPNLFSGLNKIE